MPRASRFLCLLFCLLLPPRTMAESPQEQFLRSAMRAAATAGLEPADYTGPDFAANLRRYVADLHYGRIDPAAAGHGLRTDRSRLDVDATVAQLLASDDVARDLAAVEPTFIHYHLLKAALARYRVLAQDPSLTELPTLPRGVTTLRPGMPWAGTAALTRLLQASGDWPTGRAVPRGDLYTQTHATAMQHFQWRHLLATDGTLGPATWRELTTPLSARVRTMELTLERWRWVPPHLHEAPIVVNIPEFRLFAWETPEDEESRLLKLEVIVGERYLSKHTPVFEGSLRYLVFRPYWDVPHSIAVKELLPKIRHDRGYLAHEHLELVRGFGNRASPVPATSANLAAVVTGQLRLRQRPGADNALGLVKFMLPNPYNVYLHSTPAQSLFAKPSRAFSHGCVRVQEAAKLAAFLLRDNPEWNTERIAAAMADESANSHIVPLAKPVPVYFVYATAIAARDGLRFFPDVYGHDAELDRLLRNRTNAEVQLPQ
jgi:murein L,D-transpeptidase YcbB/YkuD